MQQRSLPYLATERLILRPLQLTDDKAIFALRTNEQVNQFIQRPLLDNINDARHFIEAINEGVTHNNWLYWAMILRTSQQLIGTICLWHFSYDGTRAEVGYELHPDYQGAGLMQEALEKVIAYSFTTLQLNRLEAYTQPGNEKSVKLLEKNHFIFNSKNNDSGSSREIRFTLHKPMD